MIFIDSTLKTTWQKGGVVQYKFPLFIWIVHVYQGYEESFRFGIFPDFTVWLLFILLIQAVRFLSWKPSNG
jgi:hypothetical protein